MSDYADCSYNELHALQVLDPSMEPEFPEGCVIVIEPAQICATGAYVVITVQGERWFRQVLFEGDGRVLLRAVNPDHRPRDMDITGLPYNIEGVIVQRNVQRQIKHYRPYIPFNGEPRPIDPPAA